jgi:hypothetical protein
MKELEIFLDRSIRWALEIWTKIRSVVQLDSLVLQHLVLIFQLLYGTIRVFYTRHHRNWLLTALPSNPTDASSFFAVLNSVTL